MAEIAVRPAGRAATNFSIVKIIAAASAGTMIEWYDFYIFGSLTAIISGYFFPANNDPTIATLSWLATFATGFLVRPFGAIVFGHIGDLIGRKYTFLVTMTIMGLSTTVIGLMPTYAQIGILAPLALLILRLLQGLALGGEYGGAATYVAEHAPDGKRGFYTSFIQVTATAGLVLSLVVILITRQVLSAPSTVLQGKTLFDEWGWRIPFLLSAILVGISLYIRVSLRESPLYSRLKESGKTSKNPIKESFSNPYNRRLVLLALFGATAGQAVVWYAGQFYALFFLQNILKVDFNTSNIVVALALLCASPFFVVMGRLSDRVGRKMIIMAGCLIAALTYIPLFMGLKAFGPYIDPTLAGDALKAASNMNSAYSPFALAVIVFILGFYVTMVYGPIAAFLVELFPTRIRYTSMSLPYHLGNGWFGGLLPLISSSLVAAFAANHAFLGSNYIYVGLAFPIIVALITFVVGMRFLHETKDVDITAESMERK